MFCTNCGEKNLTKGAFCSNCGTKIPQTQPEVDIAENLQTQPEADVVEAPQTQPETDVAGVPQTQPEADIAEVPQAQPEADIAEVPQAQPEADIAEVPQDPPEADIVGIPQTQPEADVTEIPQTQPKADITETPQAQPEKMHYQKGVIAAAIVVVLLALGLGAVSLMNRQPDDTPDYIITTENGQGDPAAQEPPATPDDIEFERITAENISDFVTLGQYLGIEFEPLSTEVTDEEIDDRISQTLSRFAQQAEVTDRAVQNGDFTLIDFAGFHDGVQFDGGTAEGFELHIGSGQFIPGFEEQIIGHYIGDEFNVYVTFPEEYHAPDLAGADVIFVINLRGIAEAIEPELTEEFVSDNFGVATIAEFRERIHEELITEKEQLAEQNILSSVWAQIMQGSTVHRIPQDMLNVAMERSLHEMENFAAMFGMDLESLASEMFGMTLDDYIESQIIPNAENSIRQDLVVKAIAFAEGIEISDAEFDAGAERFTEEFGFESVADFIELNGRDAIIMQLTVEKVIEIVTTNAIAI